MLSRRSILAWPAASVLSAGAPRPEIQPYFPTPAHQFVWRNWDLVPVDSIATALGTSASTVEQMADQMYLRRDEAAHVLDSRLLFSVLRRNWYFVPKEQIVELIGSTPRKLEELLDRDAFYRGHLGAQPSCERVRSAAGGPSSKRLRYFRMEAPSEKAEKRFGFEEELSSSSFAISSKPHKRSWVTISYPYFCPYGDVLSREDYQTYFPQPLLERMNEQGVTAIWLHVLLRDLVPNKLFAGYYPAHPEYLARLKWIAGQCAKAGLGLYLYLNEPRGAHDAVFRAHPDLRGAPGRPGDGLWSMCTSAAPTREFLTSASHSLFRSVPELEGVILITASENPTNCYSLTRRPACPRCSKRTGAAVISEVVASIKAGVQHGKPDARVIAWDWSWGIIEDDPQAGIIAALPSGVTLQVDFERGTRIERLGVASQVDEYSLSVPGPSPRATAHLDLARKRGLAVMAKAQVGTTWELPTIPFLPVPDLLMEKMRAFSRNGLRGGMLSWTLGGCPSMNWELVSMMNEEPNATEDPVRILAEKRYGKTAAPKVRAAWKIFSDAFRSYPFSNSIVYSSFVLEGPAHRLFLKPTGFTPHILNSFDTLNWTQPFGPEKVAELFTRTAAEWRKGVKLLSDAMPLITSAARPRAGQDLIVTEAAGLYFEAIAAQIRFYLMRNQSMVGSAVRRNLQAQMETAERFLTLCRHDSRIGFEASIGYAFLPLDIREKLAACRYGLET